MSITKSISKLIKGEKNKIIEYKDYAVAMEFCINDAYQNIELCNMIADKTVIYTETLKKKPFHLNSANVFLLAAINEYIIATNKKELTLLDFGGACGAHYFEMKRFIPENISIKWYVLETEQMVKSAIEKGLGTKELEFVSSLDQIKTKIDFVHSSSALQYVPDPYKFTDMLINIGADRMFFNRMMFNESDRTFVTIQNSPLSSNGPGKLPEGYTDKNISYPHTTISLQKFDAMFSKNKYEMDWIFDEPSGSYKIKNEKIIGKGLLYIKK